MWVLLWVGAPIQGPVRLTVVPSLALMLRLEPVELRSSVLIDRQFPVIQVLAGQPHFPRLYLKLECPPALNPLPLLVQDCQGLLRRPRH